MSKRTEAAHTLGVAEGRREACERLAQFLKSQLEAWKQAESTATGTLSKVRVQFLSTVTSRWVGRCESLVTAIETDILRLKAEESAARRAFESTEGLGRWL